MIVVNPRLPAGDSMNLTNRLGSTVAAGRPVALALPHPVPSPELARLLTKILLILGLFVAAGAAGLGLYASSHAGRIYEGVHVAGLDIGGLSAADAKADLDAHFATYAETPLTLSAGEQTFAITPAAAGARLDSASTVDHAMAWGREGTFWDQSRAWARALLHGASIAPVISLDPDIVRSKIAAIAPDVVRPAVDARLAFKASGQPEIVPDSTGIRLDYVATTAGLTERIEAFASDPVPLVTHEDPAAVTTASLTSGLPVANATVDAPLILSAGDSFWHIPVESLRPLIAVDPATASLRIDRRPLRTLVAGLATEVNREATDAGITVDGNGRLAVVPAVAAGEVDVEASVAAIADGLLGGKNDIALIVNETPAAISDASAAAAVDRGEDLMDPGITLSWKGGEGVLDRGDLLRALTINSHPGEQEPFTFGLDPDLVGESLGVYAAEFDIPVQDARWRIIEGKIQLAVPESKGREINLDRGVRSVMTAFLEEKTDVTLEVQTLLPRWKGSDGSAITLGDDILGEGGTWYGDSSDARRLNVELASSYLTGWLVPPDGVFSYADSVGLITEENGFVTGLGIVDDGKGGFTTAPVIGGGICQVSTTLFQAAFWSGLPFEERYQHPYYLRTYGEAVTGLPGLDAMVNIEPDWRIDLKFRNTTGRWIAVILIPDGAMVYARIVGTDPGWDVVVPEPTISNEVKAPTDMRYTDSPEMPLGQERLVESAQDGFDVRIDRLVRDDGKVILEDSIFSSFAPSRNTTMRGTGTGAEPGTETG
ncbi:MAG: peptidoglycan binding domain-containing protein [Chloroflexota bacterium]|nr:peptidoglycan binding domain-containing protein [Chloroflexota bacterium]